MPRDRFRLWASENLQTIAFLGAYFVTVVAGNLIFASPIGDDSVRATGYSDRFLDFPNTFTPGFWTLLFCPFVVTPIVVLLTRVTVGPIVRARIIRLPEFTRLAYVVIVTACFGYVVYRFSLADVGRLFSSGTDAVSSVEARFTIRERIGFFTFMPLQALLPYLTLYAFIRSISSREWFWITAASLNFIALSVLLVMINMKWPLVLFYVGIVLTIFVYSSRYAYLKTVVGAVLVVMSFLGISTFVYRLAPATRAGTGFELEADNGTSSVAAEASTRLVATAKSASVYAPAILLAALNRMAISYPYYYQVFTAEGPVCGGIIAQARRNPGCRPSKVIYNRIFGNDGFQNRGTAGLSVHVSAYALGGWPLAIVALVAGSVILGLFRAVPLDHGPVTSSLVILGAITGYHLSQVPGEGVIFYEHGLLWTFLLIGGYALWWRLSSRKTVAASDLG